MSDPLIIAGGAEKQTRAEFAAGDDQGIGHLNSLTALTGAYDFDAVASAQLRVRPSRARHDSAVDGDGDAALAGVDRLVLEQGRKARGHERLGLPIDADVRFSGGFA